MKDSLLLLIIALALAIAFVALAFRENFLANPASHDWWSLSFVSTESNDGSFSVTNFGTNKTFFYEVRESDVLVESASFTIGSENGQTIVVRNPDKKPVRITVWTEGEANKESKDLAKRKEIYKRSAAGAGL